MHIFVAMRIALILTALCFSLVTQAQVNAVKPFKSVVIGNQEWMTLNWDYKTPKSFFYNNDSTIDSKYGRLYYYSNALAAAPPGWHLPTLDEYYELINYLGGINKAGPLMLSTDTIGLNLLCGGYKSANISADNSDMFGFLDVYAFYWTATPDGEQTAYAVRILPASGEIEINTFRRANGFSVRYVKDKSPANTPAEKKE